MARLRLDARKVQTAQTALKERREKTQSMKSARWPRKLREWGGGGHTRRAIFWCNGRRTGTAGSWRDASTADGLSAVRTSSSLMHTLAAVDQRACTAGGWRCAGAADGRKAEARAHKLERDAHAMRTHAVGRCACARQAAGLMPALPTAGRPHLVLTGSRARHARAAIGLRAYTAGSWCDASAAEGRKAAARAHELGGDAHARYHGQRELMAGSWRMPHLLLMSSSAMHTRAAIELRACTAGSRRDASAAESR